MRIGRLLCTIAALTVAAWPLGGVGMVSTEAMAMGATPPEQKIDCDKTKNKDKVECICSNPETSNDPRCPQSPFQQDSLNDDQRYQAAYWLAQDGRYEDAVAQLKLAKNQKDPRILNYMGYATRKLGRVSEALEYYRQALAINPDYTLARAYLGEAFLEQGKPELAHEQLSEIEKRCGTSCVEFVELSAQIASFEATGTFKPQGKAAAAPSTHAG